MSTRVLATAGLMLAAVTVAKESGSRVELTREVTGLGTLRVLVPRSWQAGTRAAAGPGTTLEFTPVDGDDFRVLLTLVPPRDEGSLAPAALRKAVERAGRRALARAVETVLEVQELRGPEVRGFYFSLTDRDPGESYAHLTQGEARVGAVVATFTILQRTPNVEIRRAGLDLVRAATLTR